MLGAKGIAPHCGTYNRNNVALTELRRWSRPLISQRLRQARPHHRRDGVRETGRCLMSVA